jgi:hypothetical protein
MALDELIAKDAVPNNEPVIPLVTTRVFRLASEPDTKIFFQFGILYTFYCG